jgi:hypothetical protein
MLELHFSGYHTVRYHGRTLQKIFTFLTAQQKMGKIKQLFKLPDNTGKLETCKQELNKAIVIFRVHLMALNPGESVISLLKFIQVRAWGSTLSQIENVKKDAKQQHDEFMALLNAHPDLSSSDRSSVSCNFKSDSSFPAYVSYLGDWNSFEFQQ